MLDAGLSALRRADPLVASLVGAETAARLCRYSAEIERFNPQHRLVGAKTREELVVKHLLDSLSPLGSLCRLLPEPPARVADVGSGAGLPGIPLALCLPQHQFTLLECRQKRARFLRGACEVLGLSTVAVEALPMEQATPGRFSLVTFRAFKPLEPVLLKGLFRLLAPGGVLAAYKGRKAAIDVEMQGVAKHVGTWEAVPVEVPFLHEERHLVIIRGKE